MSCNHLVLNRLFTQYVFNNLLDYGRNNTYDSIVQRYLRDSEDYSNEQIINCVYKFMSKNYRNEYFYQNTLLNKLLLGRHSLNTTTALTQVPIAKSKADFILINGKANVYEIKTELDSFERLDTQIEDYYKGFNHVSVVTCEKYLEKLSQMLEGTPVGIVVLTNNNTIRFIKEAEEFNEVLNNKVLFKLMHKIEFENIINQFFGFLPKAKPVFYYDECYELFSNIKMETLYPMVLKELKKRNQVNHFWFNKVPYELKSLLYFANYHDDDYKKLFGFLKEYYRG